MDENNVPTVKEIQLYPYRKDRRHAGPDTGVWHLLVITVLALILATLGGWDVVKLFWE